MKKILIITCSLLFARFTSARDLSTMIQRETKDSLNYNWVQNDKFPTFDVFIKFSDGALGDPKAIPGLTNATFEGLTLGTPRFSKAEIQDSFDYFASSLNSSVYQEYSVLHLSGLQKDIIPTVKMLCHLLNQASYPEKEVNLYSNRMISGLQNLESSPAQLAERVHTALLYKNIHAAPYPTGTIQSLKKLSQKNLKSHLAHFIKSVEKNIYVVGNLEAYQTITSIIKNECKFPSSAAYSRVDDENSIARLQQKITQAKKQTRPKIYFAPLKQSNQAQIRLGSTHLTDNTTPHAHELSLLASGILGGGFTSKLIQELRVKRGLTYSAGAAARFEKLFGRSLMVTSTKTATTLEALTVIKDILFSLNNERKLEEKEFQKGKDKLSGSYLFSIEGSTELAMTLMSYEHKNLGVDNLSRFPAILQSLDASSLLNKMQELFSWEKQTILIMGDNAILEQLENLGNVELIKDYEKFL